MLVQKRGQDPFREIVIFLTIVLILATTGCVTTPKLTAENRKQDIQFLADWARYCSPLVTIAEKYEGHPGYEALLPQYLEYAEKAESNEEFYKVVRGYYNLICSAGHHNLIGERNLKLNKLGVLLGIVDLGINPALIDKARYWSRLSSVNLTVRAHPPFRILHKENKYFVDDDWEVDGITVPRSSQIVKVNGMNCTAFLDYIKEHKSLKYDEFQKEWAKKYLLIVYEGEDFKGWQVEFLLPDNSNHQAFVPMVRGMSRDPIIRGHAPSIRNIKGFTAPKKKTAQTPKPTENCTCIKLTDEIGYIRIKSMMPGGLWGLFFPGIYRKDGNKIQSFLENADGKYRKLIIDIRNNEGGMPSYVYENLIRPFLDEPVTYDQVAGIRRKYKDNLKPSVLKTLRKWCSGKKEHVINIKEIKAPDSFDSGEWVFYRVTRRIKPRNRYPFEGSLYILMNGRTFSAADIYVDAVKRIGLGKLVGRNTAGGCAAYLGPPVIRLPASGMIFRVETEIVIRPDGGINELFGTPPDIELSHGILPKNITREALLKDEWVRTVIDEL